MYPIDVTFHNVDRSPALRDSIARHAEKLERFAPDILACRVVVESAERHHHRGSRYTVRVHVTVSGDSFVAGRTPRDNRSHEDPFVAVGDAFDAIRRQLEDYERIRRGDVKTPVGPETGRIGSLHPEQDYGVIVKSDGSEVQFHRHSLVDFELDELEIGALVRFAEQSDEGSWASTVHVAHPHRLRRDMQREEHAREP